ncbi:MAG: HYR domain-containing protein [Saprospiraceae bacterium]|uniref:HYR domain-containing protein n=1 Tax=Candidatus Opimibacter skivensis TaxID=2982028 RepID=A0A9D7SU01_9BACT|nr:HYR domain-containing protein [Candidatus Opimibacter skivensis]
MLALASMAPILGQVTITCPTTITISCNVNPIPANTGTATASTLCASSAVAITYADNVSQMTGCMGTGILKRTWTATDQCGFSASCLQNIRVEDNTSPTLTCPPFIVISCETDTTPAQLGMAIAMDNCTPTELITISYTDHTQNLGHCNGTGSFTRHWSATDMCGNVAVCIQTVVIIDNTKPILTIPPAITIACTQSTSVAVTGQATATDNCTSTSNLVINFSDNVLGLTGCSGTGVIVRTWTAADACGNIATGTQFITVQDITAPQITCPSNVTISCESSVLPAVTGALTSTDQCGTTFNSYTDEVAQPVGCNGTGTITRHWAAIDGCGNLSTCNQTITIVDHTAPAMACPQNITVDCSVGIQPAVTGSPVISDNCTSVANLVVTHQDVEVAPLGCSNTGTIKRTWTVADACGNSTTCIQTIQITDLLKPTLTCPPPVTISCEDSVLPDATGVAVAADNCTPVGLLTINYTDNVSGLFGCNGTGILNRTWMATDLCGNTTTCVQQIWIVDHTDPVITCPANVEISCSDSSDPSHTGKATGTDNCSPTVTISYVDVAQLNGCNNTGLILRTWSAQDACGNVKTCTQLITIVDRTPPVITCPHDTLIDCGFYNNPDALGYPTGTDNCTPSGDLILNYHDDLSGLTGCTNTGVILRTWSMEDACGNIGTCVQRITVADTTAPVIICPASVVINCKDNTLPSANGKATATDYCTASLFIKITYKDDLSQAGQCNGSGYIYRVWTATDQCGNAATCTQTIQIVDHVAPEIQCPASYQISCEADRSPAAQGYARATDNCTAVPDINITYTDNIANLTGCNHTGNLYRTWKATDACGNASTCVQVLTIIDTKAPIITPPAPITVSCESSLDVSVTGNIIVTDNCTPESSLTVVITDDFTAVIGCNHTGTLKRKWVVTDLCGNSTSASQYIRIIDTTPPTITCGSSVEVNCGDSIDPSVLGTPEISDNCTAIADLDLLHFDNTAGLNGCNGTGILLRTWVVYDDCGNLNSCLQTINVVDKTAPQILLPPNITTSCEFADDLDELGRATAIDQCTPASQIEIAYKDNNIGLIFCNGTGQRERVWSATDLCGNVSTAIQYISFIDTLAPIFYTPLDVVILCDDNPTDLKLTGKVEVYTDNCADVHDVVISWKDDMTALENCDSDPVFHRIWTLTDPCGNARSSTQRITIHNYTTSQVTFPGDISIPCDQDMMNFNLTGLVHMPENACSYLMDTLYSVELGEVSPHHFGRKWVYIDYCGHAVEQTQIINMVDAVRPVLTVHDISISFAQGEEVTINPNQVVTSVTDNCDNNVSIALSQTVFGCGDFLTSAEQTLLVTATDDQGNIAYANVGVSLVGGLFMMDCPQDIVVYLQPGECSMGVTYPMAPQGLCNQQPIVEQVDGTGLTSGDLFPIGITPQVYQITDQLGYSAQCEFQIQVVEAAGGALVCEDGLEISVAFDCEAVITADMLLEGDHYGCFDNYIITFSNPNVVFENGVLEASPWINQYLEACITDPTNGNYCCSRLLIEDKLPPTLTCSDITLECTANITPQAIPHFPVPNTAVVTPLGGNQYSVIGIDNCGATTLTYTDEVDVHMCDGEFSRIITRTWVATDASGHSVTCDEHLFLRRGTIEDFHFPNDTTIYCGNPCIRPDLTPDPECIGGLTGPFCSQFFYGFVDKVIPYCGSSYAVKRQWTLVNWCNTNEIIIRDQIINVADTTAPVITCTPTIEVPADFGQCGATIHLAPPSAVDECGSYPLTYKLSFNNVIIVPVNGEFILPPLGLGEYHVVWEVRDDCGNFSTCATTIDLFDNTPPVAYCDLHTVIAINNTDPMGVGLLPARTLDDGSFDYCGPVTFRARRMDSCIDFDWTGTGHDHHPDGHVDNFDRGLNYNEYVPFSCCDAGQDYVLVQLEVMDQHGNVNYCMVQVAVQDKVSPTVTCPPDISVSCKYWFDPDQLKDLSDRTFGTVVNGFENPESARQPIIINDPGNTHIPQPHTWGLDGYVTDNCNLDLEIRVTVFNDCSGDDLPGDAPPGAVKLIERRFIATDPGGKVGFCTQRIWVINYDPFYINSNNPDDPTDDVVWPADIELTHCGIADTIEPIILNDACATVGISLKEQRFEHVAGFCVKIIRTWTVVDWCQYNSLTGAGLWNYEQIVKIKDTAGAIFTDCTGDVKVFCTSDPELTPVVDPAFQTSCYVHLNYSKHIEDICSSDVTYDVKIYLPGSSTPIIGVASTDVVMNPDGTFDLVLNTAQSPTISLKKYGLAYNDPAKPQEYYRILWSVRSGCGNITTCEDKVRLEDCKQPTPVCINGLSTVPMPSTGNITIWAKDFNASSFDNCTPKEQLRYSFSGTVYQPSRLFTCADIVALGAQIPINIWVWDNWNNKDYCQTTIVFTDPTGVCGLPSGGVSGVVATPQQETTVANVGVKLMQAGQVFSSFTTTDDGTFNFPVIPAGTMYSLEAARDDNPRNGVSTIDLLKLQQHILGVELLTTPYQMIAADANNSGKISAIDLVEIRKLILGRTNSFPDNKSWRFIPKHYVFSDPYNPWPFEESSSFQVDSTGRIEDFVGVKIGDLNQSVNAHLNGLTPRSEKSASFSVVDKFVNAGDQFDITLDLSDFGKNVFGGQWALKFDGLKVESIFPLASGMNEEMWFLDGNTLRCSWTSKDAIPSAGVMTIHAEALKSGMISEMVTMDRSFMASELYDGSQESYNLSLDWKAENAQSTGDEIELHQNRPNPWEEETIIPFELPEKGDVTISITNALGVEMTSITREFGAGKQQYKITNERWPAGLYYYTLRFGDFQLTKTMLILNKR